MSKQEVCKERKGDGGAPASDAGRQTFANELLAMAC